MSRRRGTNWRGVATIGSGTGPGEIQPPELAGYDLVGGVGPDELLAAGGRGIAAGGPIPLLRSFDPALAQQDVD